MLCIVFFCFKHKTAYEMRISDWSSDVCSSDLLELLFSAFPRLIRDLSAELGKLVAVELEGGDVELDREMIEMIRDPMTHLLRNAIAHGIESSADRVQDGKPSMGLLSIAQRQSGNKIVIAISNDRRGLNQDRIAPKDVAKRQI